MKKQKEIFRLWAVKDTYGEIYGSSISVRRKEAIKSFLQNIISETRNYDTDWKFYYKQGYRCIKLRCVEVD